MGAGPFFYGKKSPTPERILSYAEGCPASAGLWIKKKQVVRTAPVLPVRGGGPCASTVVGASAAADILQEPWTTVGRAVEMWKGKIGDPEAPVSVFPTEWKLDVRQGIRSFQDLMPPPPGKPGPPPLQGGLGLWPCWYLYEYTSILQEPGGQAQEESAGSHRVSSLLGWSTRAIVSGFLVRSRSL